MQKSRNIAVFAVLAIAFAWMAGCGGCNPEPVPTGMNPSRGSRSRRDNCSDYR